MEWFFVRVALCAIGWVGSRVGVEKLSMKDGNDHEQVGVAAPLQRLPVSPGHIAGGEDH